MPRLLLASLLFSFSLHAQNLIVTATPDKKTPGSGERVSMAIVVKNPSATAAATSLDLQLAFTHGAFFLEARGDGWSCIGLPGSSALSCTLASLGPGVETTLLTTFLAPVKRPDVATTGTIIVHWKRADGTAAQTFTTAGLSVAATTPVADVGATWVVPSVLRQNESVDATLVVQNRGPADAGPVYVQTSGHYYDPHFATVPLDAPASGAGWTCIAKPHETLCRIDSLRSGESSTLTMRVRTPDLATRLDVHAVVTAEARHDPNTNDNFVHRVLSVGNVEDYERVLLPITVSRVPGFGGSLWNTEARMFIDNPTPVALFPEACGASIGFPPAPGVHAPFDPFDTWLACATFHDGPRRNGNFVVLRKDEADKVTFNIRVRDLGNPEDRWGTEIPAVRERDFRTSKIVLMPLPVGDAFRHTLRVYDLDGRNGAEVEIRVYAAGDLGARATLVRTLTLQEQQLVSPAKLPRYPAYLELDPLRGVALPADREAWVEVESLTEGLRFWAFVTVTDNANGRITTVTPR